MKIRTATTQRTGRRGRELVRVIGIDIGQSHTTAIHVEAGIICGRYEGPTCFQENGNPRERIFDVLSTVLQDVHPGVDAVGVGMTGYDLPEYRDAVEAFVRDCLTTERSRIVSDGMTAHLGAFGGDDGLTVVAGTGVIGWGSIQGRCAKVSGHGYLLGDEGGGQWIGKEVLRRVLRSQDKMDTMPDWIEEAVCSHFQLPSLEQVNALVRRQPQLMATLVPVVGKHDDDVVNQIFEQAAVHLANVMLGLYCKIGRPSPVKTVLTGGISKIDSVMWRYTEELKAIVPDANQVTPLHDPVVGAVLLFKEEIGW